MGTLPTPTKSGGSIPDWLGLPFIAPLCVLKKESPHDVPCQSHRASQPPIGWQDRMLVCLMLYFSHDPRPGSESWSCVSQCHLCQSLSLTTVRPNFLCVDAQRIQSEGGQAAAFLSVSMPLFLLFQLSDSTVGSCIISKSHKNLLMGVQVAHFWFQIRIPTFQLSTRKSPKLLQRLVWRLQFAYKKRGWGLVVLKLLFLLQDRKPSFSCSLIPSSWPCYSPHLIAGLSE